MKTEKKKKLPTLNLFITITMSSIITVILLCSILFYYIRTEQILTNNYRHSITSQFSQVNQKINSQIEAIDSIIPLYLSNSTISAALETAQPDLLSPEKRISIEKQMAYIYYSTSLSAKNFTKSICIMGHNNNVFSFAASASSLSLSFGNAEIFRTIDKREHRLFCRMLPGDDSSIYFIRNLFSSNTGNYCGTFMIRIDLAKWFSYCVEGLDPSWFICMYDSSINVTSCPDMKTECQALKRMMNEDTASSISFRELTLCSEDYFIASRKLEKIKLVSTVVAPRDVLLKDLNEILKLHLVLLACTLALALLLAIVISRTITKPIDKMIYHINQISKGERTALPPMKMYYEFDVWAESFNKMLKQLDTYYNDNFQKQLLLKSSEIRTLQSQMNPHFLFNVLNTIAWKAQMNDQEEIYQMVISLGELLKMNTLSKEKDFVRLEQEIEYVKFYVYLQQMRFEDKISCTLRIPDELMSYMVPVFCIQPLAENAIIHGLEPKDEKGSLIIQILKPDGSDCMEISIIDNGVGFETIPDIRSILPSDEDDHTHVGLRNLDKRLELLFGPGSRLNIDSIPGSYTTISFKIPLKREEDSL